MKSNFQSNVYAWRRLKAQLIDLPTQTIKNAYGYMWIQTSTRYTVVHCSEDE